MTPSTATMPPKPPSKDFSPSRSHSGSSSYTQDQGESVRSNSSSEDGTLLTQHSHSKSKDGYLPRYSEEKYIFFGPEKQRISREFDCYDTADLTYGPHLASSSSPRLATSKIGQQLAAALGPDNAAHSMEIDTIPCAGVRIKHGPLTGLLAWRLVVCIPQDRTGNWWEGDPKSSKRRRRGTLAPPPLLPPPPHKPNHSYSYSEWNTTNPVASLSSNSLPLPQFPALPRTKSHQFGVRAAPLGTISLVTNFILDTSLPHSVISRDTLLALGYPFSLLPPPLDPNEDLDDPPTVTLSVQGITTHLRLANPGEASRLGVQFLQDAGVSVFFPRDGDGVGPVLYLEHARALQDVPTTLPNGARGNRQSLQQRVRILFGMAS